MSQTIEQTDEDLYRLAAESPQETRQLQEALEDSLRDLRY